MEFSVSSGAAVLFPLLYFLDTSGLVSALLPASAVHELGHFLALRQCRAQVTALRLDILGLRMDYCGRLSTRGEIFCALAGPLMGYLFALAASLAGHAVGSVYLHCTAGVSFFLSCFNLFPALPLDGGRILFSLWGDRTALPYLIGILSSLGLFGAGLYFALRGEGFAGLLPGAFLLVRNLPAFSVGVHSGRRSRYKCKI